MAASSPRRAVPRAAALGALLVAVLGGAVALALASRATQRPGDLPWAQSGPAGRVALHHGWTVASDPSDGGLAAGWQHGAFPGRRVDVPFSPNAATVTGPAGQRAFDGSIAWYRRPLTVPRTGTYVLRFASVNHLATVWIDGRRVGEHAGVYLPFELRVRLAAGRRHVLVVRADWRDPAEMKQQGWHRTWFNFGGINREVTLRPLGRSELLAPGVRTRLQGSSALVDLSVPVRNDAPTARVLGVSGTLGHGGDQIAVRMPGRRIAPGATAVLRTTLTVRHAALWSPEQPRLYDLDLSAGSGEGAYHLRTGLRELSWARGTLRLNGRPLVLRGASLQEDVPGRGDALRPSDQAAIVRDLRGLGANATRAQHPLDEALLERLDAAGVLVWQGVGPVDAPGSWTSTTPALRREAHRRVLDTALDDRAHPCIVAWNLVNEVAGNGHAGGQAAYVRDAARALHADDPGRPVAVDLWGVHPPSRAGSLYRDVDAIGVTNYLGWYEPPLGPRAAVEAAIRARMDRMRRLFPHKVLIVSEFGAEANAENPADRPGGFTFQSRVIAMHLDAYRRLPWLAGMLVWDLRDFAVAPSFAGGSIRHVAPGIRLVRGLNQKGLLTYQGRPKPAAAEVRRAFARLAAASRADGGL